MNANVSIIWKERSLAALALLTFFSLPLSTALTSLFSTTFLILSIFSGAWLGRGGLWRAQTHWLLPLLLFFLLPFIGLLWSIDPEPNYFILLHKSYFWLLAVALSCLSFSEIKVRHMLFVFIAGVEFNVILLLLAKLNAVTPSGTLYTFMLRGYITYSLLLVFATVLLSFWYKQQETGSFRIGILIMLIINICAIALLKGKSGYLAFALLSPVILSNVLNLKGLRLFAVSGLLILVFCSVPQVQQRITTLVYDVNNYSKGIDDKVLDSSAGIRLLFWRGGYEIFKAHPVFGVGTGGYPYAMRALYPKIDKRHLGSNPHNYYVYLMANYGLTGLLLYNWLLFTTIKKAWPYRSRWGGFAVITGIMVISVGCLSDITPLSQATGILFGFLVGFPVDEC